jgi:glutamate decarboxylase
MADLLLEDFQRAIEFFASHPVSVGVSEKESGGFKHT